MTMSCQMRHCLPNAILVIRGNHRSPLSMPNEDDWVASSNDLLNVMRACF